MSKNKLDIPSLTIREKSGKKLKKRLCSLKCHQRRELPEHPECCKEVGKPWICEFIDLNVLATIVMLFLYLPLKFHLSTGQSSSSNKSIYCKENRKSTLWMDLLSLLLYFSTLCGIFYPRSLCGTLHYPLHCPKHPFYGYWSTRKGRDISCCPSNCQLCKFFHELIMKSPLCTYSHKEPRKYNDLVIFYISSPNFVLSIK